MKDLVEFRGGKYSQFGDEGIIQEILSRLKIGDKDSWCAELGAWDGIHLSNTRALVERGWNAVLIEGDKEKAETLKENCASYPKAIPVNEMTKDLDDVLHRSGAPGDLEFFSLDVDGDEWWLWYKMREHSPKVMVVEANYTFPFNVEFIQKRGLRIGSSALSLALLGAKQGYTLVAYNVINCFFVRTELLPLEGIRPRNFVELFHLGSTLQMGCHSSYDGERFLSGDMVWGKCALKETPKMSEVAAHFKVNIGEDFKALMSDIERISAK